MPCIFIDSVHFRQINRPLSFTQRQLTYPWVRYRWSTAASTSIKGTVILAGKPMIPFKTIRYQFLQIPVSTLWELTPSKSVSPFLSHSLVFFVWITIIHSLPLVLVGDVLSIPRAVHSRSDKFASQTASVRCPPVY